MCQTPNSGSQPHLQCYQCHGIQISCLNTLNLLFFCLFFVSTLCEVWQLISELPSLSIGSGLSESQQLKPNVITVFVKGLDERLRMGMAPCAWYSRDTIVRTSLTAACPLSWINSPRARGKSGGIARACFCAVAPADNDISVSPQLKRPRSWKKRSLRQVRRPTPVWASAAVRVRVPINVLASLAAATASACSKYFLKRQ